MRITRQQVLDLPKITVSSEMATLLNGIWHKRLHSHGIAFSYLAARTFHVVRYPTRPDRNVIYDANKPFDFHAAVKLLDEKSEAQWEALSEELKTIHAETKSRISLLTNDSTIELERALTPSANGQTHGIEYNRDCDNVELFPAYAAAAQAAGHQHIAIDVDIVSGWSTESTNRYGDLQICHKWPVHDILVVSDLLKTQTSQGGPLEGNEWLCLNRKPNGLMKFAVSGIRLTGAPTRYADRLKEQPLVAELAKDLKREAAVQAATRRISARIGISTSLPTVRRGPVSKILDRIAIFLGSRGI